MFKNVTASFIVFAFDTTNNTAKTGDAANITAYVSKDYGTVTVLADTSAVEMDATNAKGYYKFDASASETNGDCLLVTAKSATVNIAVIGAPAVIFTRPTTGWTAPTTAGRTITTDASGNVTLADGVAHGGALGSSTATFALSRVSIVSQSSNTAALTATGNGTGSGIVATSGSGATGDGIQATAGSTNGNGLALTATGTGNALKASSVSGDAILTSVATSGHGATFAGTGTTKHGINATGGATGSAGISAAGGGVGAGIRAIGGATGAGVNCIGGGTSGAGINITTTSGDGIEVAPTAGHGLHLTANGTSKHGLFASGGTAGTSDGISAVAGTGGVPIRGNITGDITGNLSGSVASVTGAVGSVTGAVGSVAGNVGGNVAGSVGSVTAAVTVGTNNDKTGYALSSAGAAAVMTTQMTESYAALGAAPTPAQILFEQRAILAENDVTGTTVTARKLDGSTTAATYTINSATTPTNITRAS